MTRHLVAVDTVPDHQCLLCGLEAETYVDLCDLCARTVAEIAARVAGGVIADREAGR